MTLKVETAGAIVSAVKTDPNCKKNIDSILAYVLPDGAGITGGTRNFLMVFADVPNYGLEDVVNFFGKLGAAKERYIAPKIFSNKDPNVDKLICTGIAEATAAVINAALKTNKALGAVESAALVSRKTGMDHAATLVTMKDGTDYVFDWHTTLAPENPTIYQTANWHKCSGGVLFSKFGGFS